MINFCVIHIKKLLLKVGLNIPSFCKMCGREVRDFSVTNDDWDKIRVHIKYGNILCYNCFSDLFSKHTGRKEVWNLY